jgi:hypothetical protein
LQIRWLRLPRHFPQSGLIYPPDIVPIGYLVVGMANAHANTMNMTVNVNRGTVIKTLVYLVALGAVALATSFARGEDQPPRATVNRAVHVKQVTGAAEYAYDSTGWRPLTAGKILHAGASIRTGNAATVVLAMEQEGSLVRVGPARRLELAAAAPAHETAITIVPLQASINKAASTAPQLASE